MPETAQSTKVRWKIFSIIFLLVVVNLIDRVSLSIGMPTIAHEFDLSPAMQGIILSSFFWAYSLLQIPGGWMIDRSVHGASLPVQPFSGAHFRRWRHWQPAGGHY